MGQIQFFYETQLGDRYAVVEKLETVEKLHCPNLERTFFHEVRRSRVTTHVALDLIQDKYISCLGGETLFISCISKHFDYD